MDDILEIKDQTKKEFAKTQYLKLIPNIPLRIRVLDPKSYKSYKHYISFQKISVICLGGEDCPICERNQKLVKENPGVPWAQIKGIINRQERYSVNVLNRTLVKKTSKGKLVYADLEGNFPAIDVESGEILSQIEPASLNTVEVFERGYEVFFDMNVLHKTVKGADGKPLGWNNFDMQVYFPGGKAKPSVQALPIFDAVEVPAETLYNIPTLGILLEPDEIVKVLNGVQLRDIYAARRSLDTSVTQTLSDVPPELQEMENSVNALFAEGTEE